jgi:hypothetical protein
MNSIISNRNRWLPSLVLAVASAGAQLTMLPQPAQAQGEHRDLTGTWLVQVQQYDCNTEAALGPAFPSFLTFGADRTLIETTANPGFEPGQRSPGHGLWERTRHDGYRAVSQAFIIFSSPAHNTVPAFAVGRQRIEQEITLSAGGTFKSDAQVFFTDPNGTVLRSGCASATGARMED